MVSIIMPAHDTAEYIRAAIESVIDQTYSNWELLIVDDASTDDTVKLVERYVRSDSRVRLFRFSENKGPAAARNLAIQKAEGDLIAFLDGDDYYYRDFLERIVGFMDTTGAAVAYASYDRVRDNGRPMRPFRVPPEVTYEQILYSCPISCLTGVYNARKCGKVFMDSIGREDYSLWLKLLRDKVGVAYGIEEPLAMYRLRRNSNSRNKIRMAVEQWKVYRDYLSFSLPRTLRTFVVYVIRGILKYLP